MSDVYLPMQWAPTTFSQPILPNWGFHLFSVNVGTSSNPEKEQKVLQAVGSYGKQLGHLAEALEVVIKRSNLLKAEELSEEESEILQIFMCEVAAVRRVKS